MNLPAFYDVRRDHALFDRLSPDAVTRLVSEWRDPKLGILTIGEWTNNWAENERIWEWITPSPRWGPLDFYYFAECGASAVRERLLAVGDITPVMYRVHNHCEVILRAGRRLLYCRVPRDGEDPDAFELDDRCILGVLPVTYGQFLVKPATILRPSSDYNIQKNLRDWVSPAGVFFRRNIATAAFNILQYFEEVFHKRLDIVQMEMWSDEEWDTHDRNAVR